MSATCTEKYACLKYYLEASKSGNLAGTAIDYARACGNLSELSMMFVLCCKVKRAGML